MLLFRHILVHQYFLVAVHDAFIRLLFFEQTRPCIWMLNVLRADAEPLLCTAHRQKRFLLNLLKPLLPQYIPARHQEWHHTLTPSYEYMSPNWTCEST